MEKKIFLAAICFAFSMVSHAQKSSDFYLGLGANLGSFQDTKYSDVRYGGAGGGLELGWQRQSQKSIIGAGLVVLHSGEKPATHDKTSVLTVNPSLQLHYLRGLNERLFIGGRWDVGSVYFKQFQNLGNNSLYATLSSNLLASALYKHQRLTFGLDLGLLSYFKEVSSFAFSVPQKALEKGDFQYQDESITNPFSIKYGGFQTLFSNFQIGTNIRWQFSERFSLGYRWEMRRFSEVENFPVTMGANTLLLRWNFVHRTRETLKI